MKLTDSIAAKRRIYRRLSTGLPDLVVIDIARHHASSSLSLGRYYPVILETELEMIEFEHFLGCSRPRLIAPDLLDHRASSLQSVDVKLCHYEVDEVGWPYILLCQWPSTYTQLVRASSDLLARGAYTIEMFSTAHERSEATRTLQVSLSRHGLAPALIMC